MATPSFGVSDLAKQVEIAVPIHKTEATTDQWLVCIKLTCLSGYALRSFFWRWGVARGYPSHDQEPDDSHFPSVKLPKATPRSKAPASDAVVSILHLTRLTVRDLGPSPHDAYDLISVHPHENDPLIDQPFRYR
jgi:hypothetical protein